MEIFKYLEKYDYEQVVFCQDQASVETISSSLTKIFAISKEKNIPTYVATNRLAEERIARVAKLRSQFLRDKKIFYPS